MYLLKKHKILLLLLVWRLLSVFIVQTSHVPDEYWQSLEVAHHFAFGYGYLTWEWNTKIRSCIYPFLISILYRILATLRLDNVATLTMLPRLFQAIFSAYGDYRFYKWTKNKWMLYSLCINWYWYYCATRTLINSVETTCTIIALSIFPWRDSGIRDIKYMWIVGFLTMARPTALIVWLPLCLYHFATSIENKFTLIRQYSFVCLTCLLISSVLDTCCYGSFTLSPWNFFCVNVIQKIGESYGKQHVMWYIFLGLPIILGLYYVEFIIAIYQIIKHPKHFHRQAVLLIVVGWTLSIYSLLSHKEFRFIMPLLPILIYMSASCKPLINNRCNMYLQRFYIALLTLSNILPGLYFSLIHQRGTLDVMQVLRSDIDDMNIISPDLLFLTPCHATPMYSHLHTNISVQFLTCEPNLESSPNYTDEADKFFEDPLHWLNKNYIHNRTVKMPSHVVVFKNLALKINKFLKDYRLVATIFHTHFPQSNYEQYITVYKHVTQN